MILTGLILPRPNPSYHILTVRSNNAKVRNLCTPVDIHFREVDKYRMDEGYAYPHLKSEYRYLVDLPFLVIYFYYTKTKTFVYIR